MKTTTKNNTSKGFLLCFRPFSMERAIRDASNDSDLKSLSVNEKQKMKSNKILEERLKSKVYSSDRKSIDGNQKKTARRILSKIVKAVAFESSLSKKVRNGKIIQDPLRTDSSLSEKIANITDFRKQKSSRKSSEEEEEENDLKICSTISNSSISSSILNSSSSLSVSSSTSSSSIASSCTSSESNRSFGSLSGRQNSFRSDSFQDEKKQNISSTKSSKKKKKISGICLLLISLCVLIFWGKFFAILCTSTWFYFVSTTRRDSENDNEPPMLIKSPEIQSKEYKKKIIMEGFLERNHRGFHLHQQ